MSSRTRFKGRNAVAAAALSIAFATAANGQCSFSFDYPQGAPLPAPGVCSRNVQVNTAADVSVDKPAWVNIDLAPATVPAGSSTLKVTATLNAGVTGLAVGTYTGTITLSAIANGIPLGTLTTIPVSVKVHIPLLTAPSLVVTPLSYTISYQIGGSLPPSQPAIAVSTNVGTHVSYTVTLSGDQANGHSWLTVSTLSGTTPDSIGVQVNVANLTAGVYNGAINVGASNTINPVVTVPVKLTVIDAPSIVADPASLSYNYELGSAAFAGQQSIAVTSSGTNVPLQVSTSGEPWLNASPSGNSTPSTITVTVNPDNVGVGSRTALIQLASGAAKNSPATIPVTLNITPPKAVSFIYQSGFPAPDPVCFPLIADSPGSGFSVSTSGQPWLSATPSTGTTPAQVCIAVQPTANQATGAYSGIVNINGLAGTSFPIRVTLAIRTAPVLTVSPTSLAFRYLLGDPPQQSQQLTITSDVPSSGLLVAFAASTDTGGDWLAVSAASDATPASLQVSLKSQKLSPGSYTGTIIITSASASNSPVTIPVTLTIPDISLSVQPSTVRFTCQVGSPGPSPAALLVNAKSADSPVPIPVNFNIQLTDPNPPGLAASTWMVVNPTSGTTPGSLSVSPVCDGLPPKTYSAKMVVISPAAPDGPITVPVTLVVTNPKLIMSPPSVTFNVSPGGAVTPPQFVTIGSSGRTLNFTVSKPADAWVKIDTTAGQTSASVAITVDPSGLAAGAYTSVFTVSAPGTDSPQTITVFVAVRNPPALQISPQSLSFSYQPGFNYPPGQTITLAAGNSTFTVAYSTDHDVPWLQVYATGGTTPASIPVSVNPSGLSSGTYSGRITITPATQGNPVTIPVTLNVTDTGQLYVDTNIINFTAQAGTLRTQSQTFQVSSTGDQIGFKPSVNGGAFQGVQWVLSPAAHITTGEINPATGEVVQKPATVTVSMNPANVAPGSYDATISILQDGADPEAPAPPELIVKVHFTVTDNHLLTPYLIDGGGWRTSLTLVNTDSEPAPYTINFYNADGTALAVPLSQFGALSSHADTIPAGGAVTLRSTGTAGTSRQGWAQVVADRSIGGTAIVEQLNAGGVPAATAVPIQPIAGTHFIIPYDNTQLQVTTLLLLNPDPRQATDLSLVFHDEDGRILATQSLTLGSGVRRSLNLQTDINGIANSRGSLEITSTVTGISAVGLRTAQAGTFVPLLPAGAGNLPASLVKLTVPHLIDGGTWQTSVTLTNTGTAATQFSMQMLNSYGSPWALGLAGADPVTEYSDVIPAGGSRTLGTAGLSGQLSDGSAQIRTTGSLSATVDYRQQPGQGQFYEGAVRFIMSEPPGNPTSVLLPFDNTGGALTAIALSNEDPALPATASIILRSANGQTLGVDSVSLNPLAHQAFLLSDRFHEATNSAGTAEISLNRASVPVLCLQVNPDGSFSPFIPFRK